MKTKQTPPQWLTDDMTGNGMTITVINYVSGKIKKLKDSLNWMEFILIWSIMGDLFEKTAYFQRRVLEIKNLNNDPAFLDQIKKEMVPKNDHVEKFFMKFLPFNYALFLCDDFWGCYRLSDRRTLTRGQEKQLLEKIQEITTKQVLDREMLRAYANLARDSKTDQLIVSVLISNFILTNPKEMFFFKDNFSHSQIKGICNYWSKQIDIPEDDLLSLYNKTNSKEIPKMIFTIINKGNNKVDLKWLGRLLIEKLNSLYHEKDRRFNVFREDWFPVLHFILDKKLTTHFAINEILIALPKYDPANTQLVSIVKLLIRQAESGTYGMSEGEFCSLYNYSRLEEVAIAYAEGIKKFPNHLFKTMVQVFEICRDEVVLTAAAEYGLPTVEFAEENVIFFLDWLRLYSVDRYKKAKEIIINKGVIDIVWKNAKKYDHGKFIKFAEHFL